MKKVMFFILGITHLLWSLIVKNKTFDKTMEEKKKELVKIQKEKSTLDEILQLKDELMTMSEKLDSLDVDCRSLQKELQIKCDWFESLLNGIDKDHKQNDNLIKYIKTIPFLLENLNRRIVLMNAIQTALNKK